MASGFPLFFHSHDFVWKVCFYQMLPHAGSSGEKCGLTFSGFWLWRKFCSICMVFHMRFFLNGTLSFKVVYGVPESSSKYIEENLSIGNGQRTNIPLSVNSPLNRKETGFLQSVLLTFALLCHIFYRRFPLWKVYSQFPQVWIVNSCPEIGLVSNESTDRNPSFIWVIHTNSQFSVYISSGQWIFSCLLSWKYQFTQFFYTACG